MDEIQIKIWDVLTSMSGEEVAGAFTNYYGNQTLTKLFGQFLVDEGFCNTEDLGLEEEE